MPITQVKAPDGSIIRVQHPDGATDEEIIQYAQAQQRTPPASPAAAVKTQGPAFPQGSPTPVGPDLDPVFQADAEATYAARQIMNDIEANTHVLGSPEEARKQGAKDVLRIQDEIRPKAPGAYTGAVARGLGRGTGEVLQGIATAPLALPMGAENDPDIIAAEQQRQQFFQDQNLPQQGEDVARRVLPYEANIPATTPGQMAVEGAASFVPQLPLYMAPGALGKEMGLEAGVESAVNQFAPKLVAKLAGKGAEGALTFGGASVLRRDRADKVVKETLTGMGFGVGGGLTSEAIAKSGLHKYLPDMIHTAVQQAAGHVGAGTMMTAQGAMEEGKAPTAEDFFKNNLMAFLLGAPEGIKLLHGMATDVKLSPEQKKRAEQREANRIKLDTEEYADSKSQRLPGYEIKPGAAARFVTEVEPSDGESVPKRTMGAGIIEGFSTSVTLPDGRKTPHAVLIRDSAGELHAVLADNVIPISEGKPGEVNKPTPLAVAEEEAKNPPPPEERFAGMSTDKVQELAVAGDQHAIDELKRRKDLSTKRRKNKPIERRTVSEDRERVAHALAQDAEVRKVVEALRGEGLTDADIADHADLKKVTGLSRGEDKNTRFLTAQAVGPVKPGAEVPLEEVVPGKAVKQKPDVDQGLTDEIAQHYEATPHAPDDPAVKSSYDAFKAAILKQWHSLVGAGYKLEPANLTNIFSIYKNADEMIKDVRENKHLTFNAGRPDNMPEDHPLAEPVPGMNGLIYNDIFRAVHDVVAHATPGVDFSPAGEAAAWLAHSHTMPEEAQGALGQETIGQNSTSNQTKNLGAAVDDRPFPPQKANILSADLIQRAKETYGEGLGGTENRPDQGVLQEAGPAVQHEQPTREGNAVERKANSLDPATNSRIDTLARAGHYTEAQGARLKDAIASLPDAARALVEARMADGTLEIRPWSDVEQVPGVDRKHYGADLGTAVNDFTAVNEDGSVRIMVRDNGNGVDPGSLRHELSHAFFPNAETEVIEEGIARTMDVGRQILDLAADVMHGNAPSQVEFRMGQVAQSIAFMLDDLAQVHKDRGADGVIDYTERMLAESSGLNEIASFINAGEMPAGGDTGQYLMMAALRTAAEDLGVHLEHYMTDEPLAFLSGADPKFFDRLAGGEVSADTPPVEDVKARVFQGPTDKEVERRIKLWRSPGALKEVQDNLGPVKIYKKDGKAVHATGNVTPALAYKLIKNVLTDGEIAKAKTWYHDLPEQFAKIFPDPEEAKQALVAWALTQQNTSPSGGFQAFQRVKDKIFGGERKWSYDFAPGSVTGREQRIGKPIQGGVAAEKVEKFLRDQEIVSEYSKIPDFRNAVVGDLTRDYFKNDPRAGMPAPFDVWAMRARGHMDDVVRKVFDVKRGEKEPISKDPKGATYEEGNIFYQKLADYLTSKTGEKWLPAEAQAVDWVRVQKAMGAEPEHAEDIIRGSTYGVNTERLPESQAHIADAAKLTGVTVVPGGIEEGTGKWVNSEGNIETEPAVHVQVVGSNEAVRDFLDTVGYKAKQTEVIAARSAPSGDTPGIDVMFNSPATPEMQDKFFAALKDEMPDFFRNNGAGPAIDPDGRRGFRMLNLKPVEDYTPEGKPIYGKRKNWKTQDIAGLAQAVRKVAGDLGYDSAIDVVPGNFEVIRERNEWREPQPPNRDLFAGAVPFHPEGENYTTALRGRQRPQIADALERERAAAREGAGTTEGAAGEPGNPPGEQGGVPERRAPAQLPDGDFTNVEPEYRARVTVRDVAHALKTTQKALRNVANPTTAAPESMEMGRNLTEKLGRLARERDVTMTALKKARKVMGRLSEKDQFDFYKSVENHQKLADPKMEEIAQVLRRVLDKAWADVNATGRLHSYITDFLPHLYKDSSKAGDFYGKRPLQPNRFTKERKFPTLEEAMVQGGLEPLTLNPVEATLMHVNQMNRFVMAEKLLTEAQNNGLAQPAPASGTPAGWERIRNKNLMMPKDAARIINNYLDPGIRGTDWKYLYNAFSGLGNAMNQVQLGMSAYHAIFTSVDAATSKLALGLEQIADGKPIKGASSIVQAGLVAPALVSNLWRGTKVLREYSRPGTQGGDIPLIVDAMQQAGGRKHMDAIYQTNAAKRYAESLHALTSPKGRTAGEMVRAVGGTVNPIRAGLAALDVAAKPIMEWLVPRQKAGIFADLARAEMDRLNAQGATYEQKRAALQKVWSSVDNRMGQVVYDNYHWNKVVKDMAHLMVRSVGWNVGTITELGGAGVDVASLPARIARGRTERMNRGERVFTHKMAYAVALPLQMMAIGGMMYYLYNGKSPEKLEDYFHIPTGEIDKDGMPVKKEVASYMKDVFAYAGTRFIGGTASGHPVETIGHKIHPMFATIYDMLRNRDFYDTKIRNEDDPWTQQAADIAKFAGKQFIPFSAANVISEMKRGESFKKALPGAFGVTPVKREYQRTRAENLMRDLMEETVPKGARTRAEAEKGTAKYQAVEGLRHGQTEDFEKYVEKYKLEPDEIGELVNAAGEDPFVAKVKKIPLAGSFKVFAVATPAEREKMRLPMLTRLFRAMDKNQEAGRIYYEAAQKAGLFDEAVPEEVFNSDEEAQNE